MNIAGLLGAFYKVGIIGTSEIFTYLHLLVTAPVDFNRLCAMHAMIVQADDKLCRTKYSERMNHFRTEISASVPGSTEEYVWGPDEYSCFLLMVR